MESLKIIKVRVERLDEEIRYDANDVIFSGDIASSLPAMAESINSVSDVLVKDLDGVSRFHAQRFYVRSAGANRSGNNVYPSNDCF